MTTTAEDTSQSLFEETPIDEQYEYCAPQYYDFLAPDEDPNPELWFDNKLEDDLSPLCEAELEGYDFGDQGSCTPNPVSTPFRSSSVSVSSRSAMVEQRSPVREDDLMGRLALKSQASTSSPTYLYNAAKFAYLSPSKNAKSHQPKLQSQPTTSPILPSSPKENDIEVTIISLAMPKLENQQTPSIRLPVPTNSAVMKNTTSKPTIPSRRQYIDKLPPKSQQAISIKSSIPTSAPNKSLARKSVKVPIKSQPLNSQRSLIVPIRKLGISKTTQSERITVKQPDTKLIAVEPRYMTYAQGQNVKTKSTANENFPKKTKSSMASTGNLTTIPQTRHPLASLENRNSNSVRRQTSALSIPPKKKPSPRKSEAQLERKPSIIVKHAIAFQAKAALIKQQQIISNDSTTLNPPKQPTAGKCTPNTLKTLRSKFAKAPTQAVTPDLLKRRAAKLKREPVLSTAEREAIEVERARREFWQHQKEKNANRGLAPRVTYPHQVKGKSRNHIPGVWIP